MKSLRRLMRLAEPNWKSISFAICIGLIDVIASLTYPVLTKDAIDRLNSSATATIDYRVAWIIAVILIGGIAASTSGYVFAWNSQAMGQRLKERLFRSVLRRSVGFFDTTESGALVSRIVNDTNVLSVLPGKHLSGLINGSLLLVGSATVLLLIDSALTLVIISIIAAAFLIMAPSFLKVVRVTRDINASRATLNGDVSRVLASIRLVKAMNAEQQETETIRARLQRFSADSLRFARIEAMLTPINGLALTGAMVAIFTYGAYRVQSGAMTIGTLTVFMLYIFNIVSPLIQISGFITQFQTSLGSASYLDELLNDGRVEAAAPVSRDDLAAVDAGAPRSIRFAGVEFAYPARRGAVLSIPELEFPAGSSTAIIGPSGAGKSTIFELLERFYPLETGRVLYGETDIAALPLSSWRAQLGFVSQAAPMMTGTVGENVTYGSSEPACPDRIAVALAAANCTEFVERLPRAVDTPVGESGDLISAGQKQRLALARMFYRDPQVLLLDEATANLDEANEQAVLRSLRALMEDRTTLIITHRISTLASVDRVVRLEAGRVAAILSPKEALKQADRQRDLGQAA